MKFSDNLSKLLVQHPSRLKHRVPLWRILFNIQVTLLSPFFTSRILFPRSCSFVNCSSRLLPVRNTQTAQRISFDQTDHRRNVFFSFVPSRKDWFVISELCWSRTSIEGTSTWRRYLFYIFPLIPQRTCLQVSTAKLSNSSAGIIFHSIDHVKICCKRNERGSLQRDYLSIDQSLRSIQKSQIQSHDSLDCLSNGYRIFQ